MADPARFICNASGLFVDGWTGAHRLEIGPRGHVINFDHEQFLRRIGGGISDRLIDLVEIAAFVYAADARISRGGAAEPEQGERWRRDLQFRIGVRDPGFWSAASVIDALTDLLGFLSEDRFTFEFFLGRDLAPRQSSFDYDPGKPAAPEEIVLFSGGLDSLAGAVEALSQGRRMGLVSAATSTKIGHVQRQLFADLRKRHSETPCEHFQLKLNLQRSFAQETTHRTRAFLFAALGGAVAMALGLHRLSFFENGVLSLNLPLSAAVLGARATRTTHPRTLQNLSKLFSLVSQRDFEVRNPYFWLTKTDVVRRIEECGAAELIRYSRSCAHVRESTQHTPHCGRCSQCLDRRFAILAAGLEDQDPAEAYVLDLLLGGRPPGRERVLALAYHDFARKVCAMGSAAFCAIYPEAAQALGSLGMPPEAAARRLYDLHRRHGEQVMSVMRRAVAENADALALRKLENNCLLVMTVGAVPEATGSEHVVLPPAAARPEPLPLLNLACGMTGKRQVARIGGVGDITGVGAAVLKALEPAYQAGVRDGLLPEHHHYLAAGELIESLGLESDEALRRRITRLRAEFASLVKRAGLPEPDISDLVENQPGVGYRINPTRVRIVNWAELGT